MFDYTRAAIDKTLQDIKNFKYGFDIFTQAFYVVYLVAAIFLKIGNLYANIILAVVSLAAFILYFVLYEKSGERYEKLRRLKNHAAKTVKLLVNGFTLGVSIYGISVASGEVRFITLLFALLSLVMWMFGVLVEIITYIVEDRVDYFKEAFALDKQEFKKPIGAVSNFIKKAVGAEPDPIPEVKPSRHKRSLDKQILKKKEQKRAKKAAKQEARAERRQAAIEARAAKKAEKTEAASSTEAKDESEAAIK